MPELTSDEVLRDYTEETLPEPSVADLIRQRYDLARQLLEARDALRFTLTLAPDWAREAPPGLCPTMYGTLSQEGDQEIVHRVNTARACLPEHQENQNDDA